MNALVEDKNIWNENSEPNIYQVLNIMFKIKSKTTPFVFQVHIQLDLAKIVL